MGIHGLIVRAKGAVIVAGALVGAAVLAADQTPAGPTKPEELLLLQVDGGQRAPGITSVAMRQADTPDPNRVLTGLLVTQIDERSRVQELEEGRTFSLSFSEPIPIQELLLLLVKDTNLSVVPEPDVTGAFIGDLKNVTMRQALDFILPTLRLDYSIQDNLIRVFRRKTVTRIFDVDIVNTKRTGSRSLSGSSTTGGGGGFGGGGFAGGAGGGAFGGGVGGIGGGGGGGSASVSGQDSGDVFADIEAGLKILLSEEGKFNLDRKSSILQVTDFPDRLDRIGQYLDVVQGHTFRQVLIQAKIVEVTLNSQSSNGIDWSTVFRSGASTVNIGQTLGAAGTSAFTLGVAIGDFTGVLNAFATQGKVNVLSSPRVVAMNNEPAIFRVGTQDVFFVNTTQVDATTGRILQTSTTPQSIAEGVLLSVTPQVSADGIIMMSISPSVTARTGQATSRFGDTVPIVSVRATDTIVRVHEGETIVIGGMMQDSVTTTSTKFPVLGDIPILGGLFRNESRQKAKSDLVVLLTPTILTPARISEGADRAREGLELLKRRQKP